jgi:hypothetical protein
MAYKLEFAQHGREVTAYYLCPSCGTARSGDGRLSA